MKFYDCSTAPSPRLVRIFIAEKGIADKMETVEVNLREGEHLSEEYRKINPYCTAPSLQLDDGTVFTSTQGCWRYLEEAFPEPPLMGRTAVEKGMVADMVWRIEYEGFMAVAEALRNSAPRLENRALTGPYNYAQIPELAERGRQRIPRFFETLDRILDGREWIAGDAYTAADIAGLVVVEFAGWLKFTVPDDAKNVKRWYEAASARPSAKL